jgi:hypothetical protein
MIRRRQRGVSLRMSIFHSGTIKKRARFDDVIDFAIFTKADTHYLTLFWEYLTTRGSPTGLPYEDARYAVWMKLLPFMLEVASPASKYRLCAWTIFGRTKMRRRRRRAR